MNNRVNPKPIVTDEVIRLKQMGMKHSGNDDTQNDMEIISIPYLQIAQIAANSNVIRLHPDIVNGITGYSTATREITINTKRQKYFKINSAIYPIWDVNKKIFLTKNSIYNIENNQIRLQFYPIDYSAVAGGVNDCLYQDNADTLNTAAQIFFLQVMLFSDVSLGISSLTQQFIGLTTSHPTCAIQSHACFPINDNLTMTFVQVTTNLDFSLNDAALVFIPGISPTFKYVNGGVALFQFAQVGKSNTLIVKKTNGILSAGGNLITSTAQTVKTIIFPSESISYVGNAKENSVSFSE